MKLFVFLLVVIVGAQNFTNIIPDIMCAIPKERDERASFLGGFVRLVFHDVAGGAGRANGCYDPNEPANAGLKEYSDALEPVFTKWQGAGVSRADIWVLAGHISIFVAGGPRIPFSFGRVDCNPVANPSDVGLLPTTTMTFSQVLSIMQTRMGLTPNEITALMGAHSLGGAELENSGMEGSQVRNNARFTNTYYKESRSMTWRRNTEKFGADNPVWLNANGNLRFDTDVQLLVNTTGCQRVGPHVRIPFRCPANQLTSGQFAKYANDQALWFRDFSRAFRKLSQIGYTTLQKTTLRWGSRGDLNAQSCPLPTTAPTTTPPSKPKPKPAKPSKPGKR